VTTQLQLINIIIIIIIIYTNSNTITDFFQIFISWLEFCRRLCPLNAKFYSVRSHYG